MSSTTDERLEFAIARAREAGALAAQARRNLGALQARIPMD